MNRSLLAPLIALLLLCAAHASAEPTPSTIPQAYGNSATEKKPTPSAAKTASENGPPVNATSMSSPRGPTETHPSETAERESREEERHDRREETLENRLVWLTAILAAIEVVTLVIFAVTMCANIRAARASLMSAKAAAQNAVAAKQQSDTAQRALVLTQRPKLIVRNVAIRQMRPLAAPPIELFALNHSVEGHLYVANIGSSKAIIRYYSCWGHAIQGGLRMERPDEGFQGNPPEVPELEPGQSTQIHFSSRPIGPEGPLIRQNSDGWAFYVIGWVEYADNIGVIRRTVFCRKWDANKWRLFPVDTPTTSTQSKARTPACLSQNSSRSRGVKSGILAKYLAIMLQLTRAFDCARLFV